MLGNYCHYVICILCKMRLELIQSYEDRLIANDPSVCFYEMMQETYNLIGERTGILRKEKENPFDHMIRLIVDSVNIGLTITEACRVNGSTHQTFLNKANARQRALVKEARYNYMVGRPDLAPRELKAIINNHLTKSV